MAVNTPVLLLAAHARWATLIAVAIGCGETRPSAPMPSIGPTIAPRWDLQLNTRKHASLVSEARLAAQHAIDGYEPRLAFDVNNVSDKIADSISLLPGVVSVEVMGAGSPSSRLIHLIGHESPTQNEFDSLVRQLADGGVSSEQINTLFKQYQLQAELMKTQHGIICACLVKHHKLNKIYIESRVANDTVLFRYNSAPLVTATHVSQRQELVVPDGWFDAIPAKWLDSFQRLHPQDIHQMGRASNGGGFVLKQDGSTTRIVFRRDAGVTDFEIKASLEGAPCCLVLGDDNDLLSSVVRVSEGQCEYVRIRTKWGTAMSPLDPNIWGKE